jgi:hypothetical protein
MTGRKINSRAHSRRTSKLESRNGSCKCKGDGAESGSCHIEKAHSTGVCGRKNHRVAHRRCSAKLTIPVTLIARRSERAERRRSHIKDADHVSPVGSKHGFRAHRRCAYSLGNISNGFLGVAAGWAARCGRYGKGGSLVAVQERGGGVSGRGTPQNL